MSDRLSIEPIKCTVTIAGIEIFSKEDWDRVLVKLADTMRENEMWMNNWMPVLSYLQDNPEIVGANVGDSIAGNLLDYLKKNKDSGHGN